MTQNEMKNCIRKFYKLNGNTKVNILEDYEFEIRLGECMLTLPFPPELMRDFKIDNILSTADKINEILK